MPVPNDKVLSLYLAHRRELVKYASGIVGDRTHAEDVVQEAWLRFSLASNKVRPETSRISEPVAYLFRIVRNLALDLSRKWTKEATQLAGDLALEGLAADTAGPEQHVVGRDQLQTVATALAQLPERTRRAFDMHRFEGKSFAEISRALGISQGRAHSLVQEAVAHCTKALLGGDRS